MHSSTCLCILPCSSEWERGSRKEAGGLQGSSSSPRPSSPNAAQLPFRTPPLQPHSSWRAKKREREKKESVYLLEYLFCIVLCHTKDASLCQKQAPLAGRNNNLELSLSPFFFWCIINVISSCLCPSVCVEWWVWAPGTDGLGTRADRL